MSVTANITARNRLTARLRAPVSLIESCLAKYGSLDQVDSEICKKMLTLRRICRTVAEDNYSLRGGPFDGQTVRLSGGNTGEFSVGQHRGHYSLSPLTPGGLDLHWIPHNSKEITNDTL